MDYLENILIIKQKIYYKKTNYLKNEKYKKSIDL